MIEIEIKDLTKYFTICKDKKYTLKQKILSFSKEKKERKIVLDKINLKIKKGDSIILFGINGSGKSTILKLIAKILYPNSGKILNNKKVCSVIELQSGFHLDFTGRENIYLNASIYGLSKKEIDKKMNDIINFSEIENYIDTPIRAYSSGMLVRLAFSIVINIDADIYLFDEILAVGDQKFQIKCLDKINELKKKNKTIIIVSHDFKYILDQKICNRAIWLKDAKIYKDGSPNKLIPEYISECEKNEGNYSI